MSRLNILARVRHYTSTEHAAYVFRNDGDIRNGDERMSTQKLAELSHLGTPDSVKCFGFSLG